VSDPIPKPKSKRATKPSARPRRGPAGAPDRSITPTRRQAKAVATLPAATDAPIDGVQLDAVILRSLRRFPNRFVDLGPLADELAIEPSRIQLALERLARRRMVTLPFIEPGTAGGAELTEVGLRWLISREGGKPADVPIAFQPASDRVRSEDEAARLPRADVYGTRRS
jgi:hypothetical protein